MLALPEGRAYFALDATAPTAARSATETSTSSLAPLISGPKRRSGRGALKSSIGSAASVLRAMRHAERGCGGRLDAALPELQGASFSRVDPVVIMLVVRGERALLGRGRRRPGARFSCLAGFMEPGETLEDAAGVRSARKPASAAGESVTSPPNPGRFPSTLMMGFLADALTEEITVGP